MPGPASRMFSLPPELRKQIEDDVVDRGEGKAEYGDVYERHNLPAKGITYVCFWRWAKQIRREANARRRLGSVPVSGGEIGETAVLINDLLASVLQSEERPSTGDVMKLAVSIKSLVGARAEIESQRREKEKHEEWRRKQAAALASVAQKGQLTEATIREIREKVIGL